MYEITSAPSFSCLGQIITNEQRAAARAQVVHLARVILTIASGTTKVRHCGVVAKARRYRSGREI